MESTHPLVSICIASYNGRELLEDCIASIQAQSGDFDVEIIVHDDASLDDSTTWLREHHPRIRTIASEQNVGFCVGNNRMAQIAKGEYLLLLNNDATLLPDALSSLVDMARRSPPDTILTLPQYDWHDGQLVDRGCLLDPFCNPVPNVDPERVDLAMCIGACLWIPRRRWIELGGFPEWMESIGEDLFLCCLHRLTGGVVRCAASSGYRHRQGASFGGNRVDGGKLRSTYRRRALSERNKTAVLCICTPGMVLLPLLLLHVALLLGEGLVLALLKRDLRAWREIYASAVLQTVRQRAFLRAERRRVQRGRSITLSAYVRPFVLLPRKLVMLVRHGVPSLR